MSEPIMLAELFEDLQVDVEDAAAFLEGLAGDVRDLRDGARAFCSA
jgi:hypothetical protein